jgi:hypothetical protein
MHHIKKINAYFLNKSKFEQEIAMCGFRLNDGLKEDLKELQKSDEVEESLLRKYKLICSAEHFSKSVELLLDKVEKEINDKVNIVAEMNLKSDFLYSSIQKLSGLIEKIELISQQYPKIKLDKIQEKSELIFNTLNIQDTKASYIISDDIIAEMVDIAKKIQDVQGDRSLLNELFEDDISVIYMNCLHKALIAVIKTIRSIIDENEFILSADFDFSEDSPYLIRKVSKETKFDTLKNKLNKFGFFELEKVKILSNESKQKLITLISNNKMPYGIAMFDFLGFCSYLDREHRTKYKANHIISKLFNNMAKDGTSAKHLRRSLVKPFPRYKACEQKENVIKDYEQLK